MLFLPTFTLFYYHFFLLGVNSEQLTQPASMTVQPGQALTITCQVSYSVSPGGYWTAWIRQPAGKGLEWIGSIYTKGLENKDSLKNKFSLTAEGSSRTLTLTGQSLQTEDTAVYYCARHTLYLKTTVDVYKNSFQMSWEGKCLILKQTCLNVLLLRINTHYTFTTSSQTCYYSL